MKERPILMSAPMVRAILSGVKTQTRRIVKPQPEVSEQGNLCGPWLSRPLGGLLLPKVQDIAMHCPYGRAGDRLLVRETWAAPHAYDHLPPRLIQADARIHYAATEDRGGLRWRPSIHMPRWASRILLEVTGVRVERLLDISEADAMSEGIVATQDGFGLPDGAFYHAADPRMSYASLFESINGPGSWEANPWVFVISFRRI